jgi:hypothetical protein
VYTKFYEVLGINKVNIWNLLLIFSYFSPQKIKIDHI